MAEKYVDLYLDYREHKIELYLMEEKYAWSLPWSQRTCQVLLQNLQFSELQFPVRSSICDYIQLQSPKNLKK